jgi:hypothetical protein
VGELVEAQARKALEQLHSVGWAVGPPARCEEWRRAVRTEARRAGLKIRTGESPGGTQDTDGQVHPWAVTVKGYEAMRAAMRGLELSTLGFMVVNADAGRANYGTRTGRPGLQLAESRRSREQDSPGRTTTRDHGPTGKLLHDSSLGGKLSKFILP